VRTVTEVLLVTCAALPEGEERGDLLVDALARRGITARWVPWDDPATDWSAAGVVAVRSTWDYEWRRDEFLSWARSVGPGLLNGAEVFAWNIDKSYLLDLEAAGLPVVPTVVARTPSDVVEAVEAFGASVCKPTVGASGRGVVAIQGEEASPSGEGPWLVQPLVASVRTEGETSVFVIGGRAVSQVRKLPAGAEIRVHEQYGGRSDAVPLSEEHCELATRTVRVAGELLEADLSYARVDLMRLADGRIAVGELEAIEPGFYLDLVPEAAEAFGALVERLLA
jgi:glutathione synthase/RimK-type ligase-like ATP-grasp enzyme